MENLKPTQNLKQERRKTPEDDVVAIFPADLDVATRPLTVMRSSQDGKAAIPDEGWTPGGILCLCDTDSRKGVGASKLFVEVYKPIKANGEYTVAEEIVALDSLQSLKENGSFTESYIQARYGKTPEEMLKEGRKAAGDIWNQKHPVDKVREPLFTEATLENLNDSPTVESGSDHERSSADKVGPVMGGVAVKAAGVRKPVETNKVDTSEPVREPVKKDKADAGSSALVMTKEVLASIRAIKVNAPADLPAVEPAKNPVETNETNTDILPERFKTAIDSFKQLTEDNNNQFAGVARSLTGSLSELRELIKRKSAAVKNPRITEFIIAASPRIRELEVSRFEFANKFKNDAGSLIEELKKKIESDDEQHRRLIKFVEDVNKMSVDSTALGSSINTLIDKLTEIVRIVSDAQGDGWGMDGYISRIVTVIGEIVDSDLPSVYGRRQSILNAIEAIKTAGD